MKTIASHYRVEKPTGRWTRPMPRAFAIALAKKYTAKTGKSTYLSEPAPLIVGIAIIVDAIVSPDGAFSLT